MSSNNFFDLTNGIDIFTIDSKVPADFGVRALAGADFIVGSDRPDFVYGNDGADSLFGEIGNDSLQGGRGADLLSGNAGDDFLQGERGNDVIFGGQNNDTLLGQEGDDFLAGGAGVDSLIGGDGSDAFVLNVADAVTNPALADTIADFSDEEGDVIALTDGAGDALTEADVTLEAYVANGQKMLLLRNPWGTDNSENVQAPEDPSSDTQDGFVAIAFDRFLKNFDGVSLSKA